MPRGPAPTFFLRGILAAVAALALTFFSRAADAPAPDLLATQQKVALDSLDHAIARFDLLLARDDDRHHQAATKIALDGFKQRRDALHAAFDPGKNDDLRAELNLAYQRLAAWIASAPAGSPSAPPASGRE